MYRGVLHRVAQCRRGIDGGVDLAPRRLDVGFERLDGAMRRLVRRFLLGQRARRPVALAGRAVGGGPAIGQVHGRGLASSLQRPPLRLELGGRRRERFDLLLVEEHLLLRWRHLPEQVSRLFPMIVVDAVVPVRRVAFEEPLTSMKKARALVARALETIKD